MVYHCIRYCLKQPIALLCLTLTTLSIILIHQYHSGYSPENHNSKLTRRNISPSGQASTLNLKRISDIEQNNQINDLTLRVDDLKRIKSSISNELRMIEREKAKLLKEKTNLAGKNDKLLSQIERNKVQLKQLELDISANKKRRFEQICDSSHITPVLFNPMESLNIEQQYPINNQPLVDDSDASNKSLFHFDISLCPLSKEFKFHLIQQETPIISKDDMKLKFDLNTAIDILLNHRQHTNDQNEACLFVTLFDSNSTRISATYKNHLVINLSNEHITHIDNAAIAASSFPSASLRDSIDLVIPSIWQSPTHFESIVGSIPPHSPVERKYLASYFGPTRRGGQVSEQLNHIETTLQIIHRNSIDDLFLIIKDCGLESSLQCVQERDKTIELSIFTLITSKTDGADDDYTNSMIYLALSRGTVPVLLASEINSFRGLAKPRVPFDEVLDWRRAMIILPLARLPELHFILRSIGPADLYELKHHGRRIFENHLVTAKQILDTTISIMSLERFKYPPPPVQNIETILHIPSKSIITDVNCSSTACVDAKTETMNSILFPEILGPRERPLVSSSYARNYSLVFTSAYDLWNNPIYSPMTMYPSYPKDPISPSEYKFYSSDRGYRPIGNGLGGSGSEFSRALGGDHPNEQFTIVLLTYERNALLMKTLERLKDLPYLNKIIVVWNSPIHKPFAEMVWPDVGVPIAVVKVDRNSLNNRFLPYDAIETDAILSIDDDSPLRQDEIVFAFRVWRQSRDRIVGFPGRYHAWDRSQNSWLYNSNHSCELSMVLTGGAFFHKYYSYVYSYNMPEVIRSIVDKFMNCEDIAMNFLVAHLTRKPPVKVTSRWTFHCAGCTSSLSEDDSHFRERHECLNTFASIYGYMPLLSTQHRSDSILFKTRLPHDKQKCFRYV